MAFVRLNKIKFNADDKFWMIMDENYQPFVVKLFPNPIRRFKYVGKSKCSHLLAVMHSNGMSISDGYKLPKLSELTRSKLNGQKFYFCGLTRVKTL